MLTHVTNVTRACRRTFKNFGHQRERVPGVTTLWHGFLTFTFIGMGLNWNQIGKWIFGEDYNKRDDDFLDEVSQN